MRGSGAVLCVAANVPERVCSRLICAARPRLVDTSSPEGERPRRSLRQSTGTARGEPKHWLNARHLKDKIVGALDHRTKRHWRHARGADARDAGQGCRLGNPRRSDGYRSDTASRRACPGRSGCQGLCGAIPRVVGHSRQTSVQQRPRVCALGRGHRGCDP